MSSVLLLLMVSVTQLQPTLLCPESCIVCSTDAIICSELSMIIEAPESTKVLMLTDGLIESVNHIVYADSSNMTILVLSNNIISTITGKVFQKLTVLRTLFLDHNLISSPSLDKATFSSLRNLKTLHLGHNSLEELTGSWFQKTISLKTLLLEGNLLTSLNSSTFASSDLRNLEILNLSDNLIDYVGRDSFRNLPSLRSLDLSRNRLENVPDAFSYLPQLSMLNLDLNRWNCSCELRELAHFLNSYNQSPDKVLYNRKKMVCVRSDNPKIQTVLEITKVNCMPTNTPITADVIAKSSITFQRYIRDIVLAVVFSCLGGVVITLAILAGVHRKLGRGFEPKQQTKEAEEQSSQTWDISEGKDVLSMSYAFHNSNYRGQPSWYKDDTLSDSRPDNMGNHFICQNCRKLFFHGTNSRGMQPYIEEEWTAYMGRGQWKDTDVCPSMIRDEVQRHNAKGIRESYTDFHRQPVSRQDTSSMRMDQVALRRHVSIAQRQSFTPKEQTNTKIAFSKHQHGRYGSLPLHQNHQTYIDNIHNDTSSNQEKCIQPRSSKVIVYRDIFNYNQSNMDHQGGNQTRVQKSVTFDLAMEHSMFVSRKEGPYKIGKTKMSKTLGQKSKTSLGNVSSKGNRSSTHSKQIKIHTPRSQEISTLKVKLNLNPFKRSQVYPKSSYNNKDKDIKRTSKKFKKDKSQKSAANKDSEGQENEEKSKQSKINIKSECDERSTNPDEPQSSEMNPEESCSLMQTSNLLAESIKPLDTANSSDPHVSTLDLNLAVRSPEIARSLQKELRMPQDEEDLQNALMTPVSSTVSVVQEYLSSSDGSPKRKLRLIVPEKTSSRPQTALEKKIR